MLEDRNELELNLSFLVFICFLLSFTLILQKRVLECIVMRKSERIFDSGQIESPNPVIGAPHLPPPTPRKKRTDIAYSQ